MTKPDTPTVRQQWRSRGRSYLIRGVQLQDGAIACQLASQSDRGACARRPDHVPPAIHLHTQLVLRPNTRGLLFERPPRGLVLVLVQQRTSPDRKACTLKTHACTWHSPLCVSP